MQEPIKLQALLNTVPLLQELTLVNKNSCLQKPIYLSKAEEALVILVMLNHQIPQILLTLSITTSGLTFLSL